MARIRTLAGYWPAALPFVGGLVAGYQIGYIGSRGGLEALGAAFVVLIVGAVVALLVIVGIGAGLMRQTTLMRSTLLAVALLVAGTVTGAVSVSAFGLGYKPPVVLGAAGTATLTLAGVDGFEATPSGPLSCASRPDSRTVDLVTALDLGSFRGGTFRASVHPPVAGVDAGAIELWMVENNPPPDWAQPFWTGSSAFDATSEGVSGTATFERLAIEVSQKGGPPDASVPATLSGTLVWACEAWRAPDAAGAAPPSSR